MRILGVDPGLSITGYGLIETALPHPRLIEAGALRTRSERSLEIRLLDLYNGLTTVLETHRPESMAVEALFSSYRHPTSALQMAHARGVLFLAASLRKIPVFSYEPARVKKSLTGRGRASKRQMQDMIRSVFSLKEVPEPADVADALAVALCHANSLRLGTVPVGNRTSRKISPVLREVLENAGVGEKKSSPLENLLEKAGNKT